MIDHDYMRMKNISLIFDTMRLRDELYTKRELQNATELGWATVCKSINELESKKLIEEISVEENIENADAGRPAKKYDISSKKNLMIGVDINTDSIKVVVINVRCKVLYSQSSTVFENERDSMLSAAKLMIRNALESFNNDKTAFLGIGFSLMSVVDSENGIGIYSQHMKNWENVHIKDIFESEFNLPVMIEHDPNCCAIAEMNAGIGKKHKNISFIRITLGIGMSLIINGEIYKGNSGNAGEFGHMCMDLNGPYCSCGKRGCVEAYSSISGIAARYRENTKDKNAENDMAVIHKIASAAKNNDVSAQSYFDSAANILGISISNYITLMNPDIIIIGGMFTEYASLYLDKVRNIVNDTCWPYSKAEIVLSPLENNAPAIGAAALFIQKKAWEIIL